MATKFVKTIRRGLTSIWNSFNSGSVGFGLMLGFIAFFLAVNFYLPLLGGIIFVGIAIMLPVVCVMAYNFIAWLTEHADSEHSIISTVNPIAEVCDSSLQYDYTRNFFHIDDLFKGDMGSNEQLIYLKTRLEDRGITTIERDLINEIVILIETNMSSLSAADQSDFQINKLNFEILIYEKYKKSFIEYCEQSKLEIEARRIRIADNSEKKLQTIRQVHGFFNGVLGVVDRVAAGPSNLAHHGHVSHRHGHH